MSDWKEAKISDFCEITRGGSPRPIHEYISSLGTPWVKIADATESNSRYITKTKEFIKLEGEKNSRVVYPGDLILSNSATPGLPRFMKIRACIHDGWLLLRNIKAVDNIFLYYLLLTERKALLIQGSGTIFTNLKTEILKEHKVLLPPLSEQKAIASVLSSLDDKIDLLHHQNKTLEAMAETLFRQWFIEEAQEDWEEKRLGDILTSIESGSRPKGGIDPDLKHGIPSIGAENINGLGNYNYGSTKYITSEYFEKMKRGIVQDYDVLIYKDGAYVGKKSMIAKEFPFNRCAINEHVFILRTESIFLQLFLYFALEQEELALLNANSAQPGLNQTSMKSFELLLPKSELIEMFGQTIMPLIDKIFSNGNQIRSLEKLRDTLLPKLMSGEVRVEV